MQKYCEYLVIIFLAFAAIILLALQIQLFGWILLGVGSLLLLFCKTQFRKDIFLVYLCLAILALTPISTDTNYPHSIQMGIPLVLVILIPYLVSRYVYKDHLVRFRWHHGRGWYKKEITYVLISAVIASVLLPLMLKTTGSYHNWTIEPGFMELLESYIGLNAVGFWDELFFISTVLGILRRHISFPYANLVQAILFTSFLYVLGFQGWCFVVTFIFALVQGYIFKKTESLFYVLTIHLTIDLILHLTLVYLHYPQWWPF